MRRKPYKGPGPEHEMCKEIWNYAQLNARRWPCLKWFRHWPNEGKMNPIFAKEIGKKAGPSDYFLPVPTADRIGLWLEVKVKPNKPTPSQARWIEDMRSLGYTAEWVDSLRDAFLVIETYARKATEHWKNQPQGVIDDYKRKNH